MPSSAGDSRRSEAAPVSPGLISTELERPVITSAGAPPLPEVFVRMWADMCERGWSPGEFSVTRDRPAPGPTISSNQGMSTDTGPVIELVTTPSRTLDGIASQLQVLTDDARAALDREGCAMLGVGVHPALRPVPDDYYRYRTPRPAYDYAVSQRGWHHWSIVDKASVQELVDVDFADAPRAIRLLHRLAGLMNFVLRNDPGLHRRHDPRISVRPLAWRSHVPRKGAFAGDAVRVVIPPREIESWPDYLSLLWESGPMFLVGTKNAGQAFVPEHPTFLDFLTRPPQGGWPATLLGGSAARVTPEPAHYVATDWSYMGFARIRWKWRPQPPPVAEIADAWASGGIEDLLARSLEKVVIENRGTSTQPRGEELASLALVAGLLSNLDEAMALTRIEPYAFWTRLLDESTRLPLDSVVLGRRVPDLAREMVGVARRGLVRRGESEPDRWLGPLVQRLDEGASPSERRLEELRRGGAAEMICRVCV